MNQGMFGYSARAPQILDAGNPKNFGFARDEYPLASFTIDPADPNVMWRCPGTMTGTLPRGANLIDGFVAGFEQLNGSSTLTISVSPNSGDTINGGSGQTIATQYGFMVLRWIAPKNGVTGQWVIIGQSSGASAFDALIAAIIGIPEWFE